MDTKELSEISSGLRNTFQKANEAFKKYNLEYALELFKSIVKKEPGFLQARESLRDVERQLTEQLGGFSKLKLAMKNKMQAGKVKKMIKSDPFKAMGMAEDMLAGNLSDPTALNLLAEAALAADADSIAVEAYEIFREYAPKNEKNLRNLAAVYKKRGEGTKVLTIFQEIAEMHPKDLQVEQEVRAAAALASMEQGHWDQEGGFRAQMKDGGEAEALEKGDRIARAEDDVAAMITHLEESIADGKDTIDNYRKLAEYYHRSGQYDEAVATLEKVVEKMGVLDPLIDSQIEKAYLAKFDSQIKAGQEAGEDVSELEAGKFNYRMERAVDRVNSYPNDLKLRYALAVVYWDGGYVDEALEQFQIAQRNPQNRLISIVYMGRCFHKKGQCDMAVEQFEQAIVGMRVMDNGKKEALYYLGLAYEDLDQNEKAGGCFKQIYQADINFRDIKERMKKIYG